MQSNIRKDRRSIFKELGLDTDCGATYEPLLSDKEFAEITGLTSAGSDRPSDYNNSERAKGNSAGNRRLQKAQRPRDNHSDDPTSSPQSATSTDSKGWFTKLVAGRRPRIKTAASAPPPTMSSFTRLTSVALFVAVVIPGFSYYNGQEKVALNGADAGVIRRKPDGPVLETRADSPKLCKRWSHQSAHLNGTLYIYGGQASATEGQTSDTWNNNLYTLDLTKSWDISSPSMVYQGQADGPPAVANGYLWNDYHNLYLYGGEFADNLPGDVPDSYAQPAPVSTWQYSISAKKWTEYTDPVTSAGNESTPDGVPVQRAAEGAGISVPELGISWYFGGHLDQSTSPGWSYMTPRVYLKSMLEFTHPGWSNDAVFALNGKAAAPDGGTYRNITEGGLQATDAFAERADGALVYVPGWGKKGVLIGLAGGDADTFVSDLSVLDVYDIASSQWYHQKTSGTPPGVRVNPCTVIASAPDASSFNIYLFGGQNLQPAKQQTQYSDMYILSIPSFTWVEVPQGGDNKPSGRSGHTCHLRDGQLVLVGGYTGTGCDSPGIYVFNATSLEWTSSFKALDHPADHHPDNSVLSNSFGYAVPDIVASVIGGGASGSATATTPAAGPATGGPFLTGTAPVFTVTATASATGPGVTTTATSTLQPNSSTPSSSDPSPGNDRKGGLIAAGVIAGLAGLLALYLGYCAWLYRRQVRAYKTHLAAVNRYSSTAAPRSRGSFRGLAAFFGRAGSHKNRRPHESSLIAEPAMTEKSKSSSERRGRTHRRDESSSTADSFSWVGGQALEPKLLFDDPTPDSGYSGSRPSAPRYSGQYSAVGSSSRPTPGSEPTPEEDHRRYSGESRDSTEGLLDGQEPSFFSVVLGPRRALRVVNGLGGEEGLERGPSLRR